MRKFAKLTLVDRVDGKPMGPCFVATDEVVTVAQYVTHLSPHITYTAVTLVGHVRDLNVVEDAATVMGRLCEAC